jgi:SAM-dependent methyltransferase
MDNNILKRIMNSELIDELYSNNLFTIKSIAQHLGIWDSLTSDEKIVLEKITTADSLINGHKEEYLSKLENFDSEDLGYGEINKSGVNTIFNYIKKNIDINSDDVFYDIGSGNGKLSIHLSLISNFIIKGVEIDKYRHLYSLEIMKNIGKIDNLIFINDDVTNLDISDAKIVFMNDTLFSKELISEIISKLKPGTHLISLEENNLNHKDEIEVEVSWMPIPIKFKYYII